MPSYQAPKCFVSEGEPNQMIKEFVKYLTEISTESSPLLYEQYAVLFEALKTARAPNHGESKEDRLAQTLVDMVTLKVKGKKRRYWKVKLRAEGSI